MAGLVPSPWTHCTQYHAKQSILADRTCHSKVTGKEKEGQRGRTRDQEDGGAQYYWACMSCRYDNDVNKRYMAT